MTDIPRTLLHPSSTERMLPFPTSRRQTKKIRPSQNGAEVAAGLAQRFDNQPGRLYDQVHHQPHFKSAMR
jgi:hypothetical protein